jgi:hypothetical protein
VAELRNLHFIEDENTGAGATGAAATGAVPRSFAEVSKDSGAPVILVKSRIFVWSANSESFE